MLKSKRLFFHLFLFSLSLTPAAIQVQAAVVDHIAAMVNSDVILASDINRFLRTMSLRKELDPLFGFNEALLSPQPTRQQILEALIQERLIGQQFKVSEAEVEQEIETVQRNNQLSREDLTGFLKSKGYTYDEYLELMRIGLQKRNLLDREIRTRVNITDEDVRNYFFNMIAKTKMTIPMDYSIQIIAIHTKNYKSPKAAEQFARDTLQSLKQGESFGELAKRVSDDPSASQGGELGYLSSKEMAEPLKSAVQNLKIGNISDIIKTPMGFLLVKLLEVRSTESQRFDEMKEQLREQLAREEYKRQLMLWGERMRNDAYFHVNPPPTPSQ